MSIHFPPGIFLSAYDRSEMGVRSRGVRRNSCSAFRKKTTSVDFGPEWTLSGTSKGEMNLAPTLHESSARPSASDPPSGVRLRRESDEPAFRNFVADQHDRVRAWARVLHVSTHDAEEIVQEAVLCLWLHRTEVRETGWPSWLLNAMVLRGRMHARSKHRAQKHETVYALDFTSEANWGSPESNVGAREVERELQSLVDRLRRERRAVVQRYLLDEVPMEQVAAELGIDFEAAKKRWRLAQADMRAAYSRDRAKERFKVAIAAIVAFFAAFWARRSGEARAAARDDGLGAPSPPSSRSPQHPSGMAALDVRIARAESSRFRRLLLVTLPSLAILALSLMTDAPVRPPDHASSQDDSIAERDPLLPSLGVFLPGEAVRERARVASPAIASVAPEHSPRRRSTLPRALLVQAEGELRQGNITAARGHLALYRDAYPIDPTDPFYLQYRNLSVALDAN